MNVSRTGPTTGLPLFLLVGVLSSVAHCRQEGGKR